MVILGHIVGRTGLACDPTKLAAVQNWHAPDKVKGVRQFVGFVGYYGRFVKYLTTPAIGPHGGRLEPICCLGQGLVGSGVSSGPPTQAVQRQKRLYDQRAVRRLFAPAPTSPEPPEIR